MNRGKIWQVGIITLAIVFGAATGAQAGEADHFEGRPSETVTEAIENLTTYTDELVALSTPAPECLFGGVAIILGGFHRALPRC